MRAIYFDAKRYAYNPSGLGNYSRELVHHLVNSYPEREFHLLIPKSDKKYIQDPPQTNNLQTHRYNNLLGINRTFRLESFVKKGSIVHGLSNEMSYRSTSNQNRHIVSIHDVIFREFPQDFGLWDRQIFHFKTQYAVKNADHILCISNETLQDLIRYYDVDKRKCSVVNPIVSPQKQSSKRIDISAWIDCRPKEFFVCIGSMHSRKNLSVLLDVYKLLPAEFRIPLYCIGLGRQSALFQRRIAELGLTAQIKIINYVDQAVLAQIIKDAYALLYPSLKEGFGLPVLEAVRCGTPFIANQMESVKEAGGDAGLYCDCKNPEAIRKEIMTILQNTSLVQSLQSKAKQWEMKVEDQNLVQKIIEIYNTL